MLFFEEIEFLEQPVAAFPYITKIIILENDTTDSNHVQFDYIIVQWNQQTNA